jgi:5'-3' exonuclease
VSEPPLLIADVPWLLYRAYFALPKSIVGADGEPVNALLGTVNAFLTVLAERPARAVVACFGAEQAAYRVKLYPPYHAHREPMPPELAAQWERAPALLQSLGWSVCDAAELEADDAMFSHARAEAQASGRALLLTGDRDLYAAVDERVAIVELAKGRVAGEVGPVQVRERYGIAPAQVPDLIALRGDPSDGIPGAPGVGAKTAAQLLARHGSLEAVLEAAGASGDAAQAVRAAQEMRPRIAAALRENAALLLTFKEIATMRRIEVERPATRPSDWGAGAQAARALGMNGLADRLGRMARVARAG